MTVSDIELKEYLDELKSEMVAIGQVRLHNILSKYVEYGDYALENDERFGIWGGLSERERRKLKKRA